MGGSDGMGRWGSRFDLISTHEAKGGKPGRGKNQIGSCVSFRAAGSRGFVLCQSFAYVLFRPGHNYLRARVQGRRTAVDDHLCEWRRLVSGPGNSACPLALPWSFP